MRAWLGALALLLATTSVAAAKRSIAVLEYRSGAKGLPGIGERLAKILEEQTSYQVVGPQEARRRMGAKVDAEVARCGGEAMCIGAIGEQLGVNEVFLIGVSQLGDVVVAMQRIDAKRGEALSRMAESMASDARLTDEQALGWMHQVFPPGVFLRYGNIAIVANVAGAEVTVNEVRQGKTPLDPIQVPAPGSYQVKLSKPGYAPFQAGISVPPDATVDVRATLVREARELPWYKRWYVWAIVGGAVAVAGIAVGIYFGTRVDETPMGFISAPKPGGPAALRVAPGRERLALELRF